MTHEFATALLSYSSMSDEGNNTNNDRSVLNEKTLKPIEEPWNKMSNKRNSGHYSKAPDEFTITELISSLIAPINNVNANLKLPKITPQWLNIVIGLLLSTETYGTYHSHPPELPSNVPEVVESIQTFLEEWSTSTISNLKSSQVTLSVPDTDVPTDANEQSLYILETILIPLLDCNIIANKTHLCRSCKSEVKFRVTFAYIPVNINKAGLHIEHELLTFFSPTTSDLLCSTCNKPTIRHIEVLHWPQVLIINVNNSKATFKYRKPPGIISLSQFSNWLAIGTPSSTLYDLITFNSVLRTGGKDTTVRVTKVKQNWTTSVNKKIIGNGEQLRRLYASSRK
jgi:hypothetical protein